MYVPSALQAGERSFENCCGHYILGADRSWGGLSLRQLPLFQRPSTGAVSHTLLLSVQLERRGCCTVETGRSPREGEEEDTELVWFHFRP